MTTNGGTPPGWYDDGTGQQRWFDGSAWTDHVHQPQAPVPPPAPAASPTSPGPQGAWPAPNPAQAGWAPPNPAQVGPGPASGPVIVEKPLWRRTWFLTTAGIVLLLVVIAAAASGGSDEKDPVAAAGAPVASTPAAPTTPATSAAAPTAPAAPATTAAATGKVDGDWEMVSFKAEKDFAGNFGGTARIKYNGSDSDASNNFTVTLFKGEEQVGSLLGPLLTIAPGQTKTVQFISTDKYVVGPYTVEFQKDL